MLNYDEKYERWKHVRKTAREVAAYAREVDPVEED